MKSWMKKLPDGRLVFYPWGQFMRGYIISSEQEARPLLAQIYLWLGVSMRDSCWRCCSCVLVGSLFRLDVVEAA
jgi:hypothetical protein